jgi:hypothetical protein
LIAVITVSVTIAFMVDFIFNFPRRDENAPRTGRTHFAHQCTHVPAMSCLLAHVGDLQAETEKFKLCSIFRGFSGGRTRDRTLDLSRVKGTLPLVSPSARPRNRRRFRRLLRTDAGRQERQRRTSVMCPWEAPRFDSDRGQRQLRILNAIFARECWDECAFGGTKPPCDRAPDHSMLPKNRRVYAGDFPSAYNGTGGKHHAQTHKTACQEATTA